MWGNPESLAGHSSPLRPPRSRQEAEPTAPEHGGSVGSALGVLTPPLGLHLRLCRRRWRKTMRVNSQGDRVPAGPDTCWAVCELLQPQTHRTDGSLAVLRPG